MHYVRAYDCLDSEIEALDESMSGTALEQRRPISIRSVCWSKIRYVGRRASVELSASSRPQQASLWRMLLECRSFRLRRRIVRGAALVGDGRSPPGALGNCTRSDRASSSRSGCLLPRVA